MHDAIKSPAPSGAAGARLPAHPATGVRVRPLAAADKPEWRTLWRAYLAFYDTVLPDAVIDTAFDRLLSDAPETYTGLVAEAGDGLVGLTHYVFHPHGWKIEPVCYLQDLFVAEEARGAGVGRALIEAVYAAADAAGAPDVYWMTNADNVAARALYDRIAAHSGFIKYARVR